VVFDRFPVTVFCHAQKRSGEHKSPDHIQLQRPVWLDIIIEERDQSTIFFSCQQLSKNSAPGDSLRSNRPTWCNTGDVFHSARCVQFISSGINQDVSLRNKVLFNRVQTAPKIKPINRIISSEIMSIFKERIRYLNKSG
jgi:hypothetical protein